MARVIRKKVPYFNWLISIIADVDHFQDISYNRALEHLFNTEFVWLMEMDANRAQYGLDMRRRYTYRFDEDPRISGPCTVLEMMIALSLQCEENIMTSPDTDDQTSRWFWEMFDTLGLYGMDDRHYDEEYVDYILTRFLNREYEPNGEGGLFFIPDIDRDLREVEIWNQMLWYLDRILI